MNSQQEALGALELAWPAIVDECRQVLGSELHYQALIYHCLRLHGQIPVTQLGMNVKMWVDRPKSKLFRALDKRKNEAYRGGVEPIPDVVIFSPAVGGDWRRRSWQVTALHMLAAIEIKVSERADGCLRPGELIKDIEKLSAHREEVRHLGADFAPVMLVVDTAPEVAERMRDQGRLEAFEFAKESGVSFYYLSRDEELVYRAVEESNAVRQAAR